MWPQGPLNRRPIRGGGESSDAIVRPLAQPIRFLVHQEAPDLSEPIAPPVGVDVHEHAAQRAVGADSHYGARLHRANIASGLSQLAAAVVCATALPLSLRLSAPAQSMTPTFSNQRRRSVSDNA